MCCLCVDHVYLNIQATHKQHLYTEKNKAGITGIADSLLSEVSAGKMFGSNGRKILYDVERT